MTIYQRAINKFIRILLKLKHDVLFRFTLWLAKIYRLFNHQDIKCDRKYLFLDVSSEGSLGDEAMIIGSIDFLQEQRVKEVGILSAHNRTNWQGYDKINSAALQVEFFSLNFAINDGSLYRRFVRLAQQYTHFVVPGADVMDGYYNEASPLLKLHLVSLAHATGLKCSVLGFSFNNQPKESCVNAFQKLPSDVAIHARDPLSKTRFENHTNRQIDLVSDLAFLLQPDINQVGKNQAQLWIEKEKRQGNIVIGINPNKTLAKNLQTRTPSTLAEVFSNLIKDLINLKQNISFVLIPHDYRQDALFPGDNTLCELIKAQLPEEIQAKCWLFANTRLKAGEVKNICQYLDFVITSRMHLAIACLGVKTPVLGIVYQGKFEGLYSYFELKQMLIEPQEAIKTDKLLSCVIYGLENREQTRQQLAIKLPEVVELAKQNFSELVTL